ncbi:AfsA-related hotdog domain-containing protein [Streptomyces bambusae]|uniref:A-factor biosynthesis hotdog domain-containing protein n=1 Tax=Streptomyces bambusae TaxID=1550616 RepID=A0ABS6ZDX1_9ACTN|nr:AfsA-related hotdog domain-containing protein [Streptomyces bambusae]MBW5485970.1 hypothetical protein [Streptomyces bambusae]
MDTAVVTREHTTTGAARHLVHRPQPWEHTGPAAAPPAAEEFVLTGELPTGHPLLNDGPRHFHDMQAAAEMLREVGEFIGRDRFGVPAERSGIFYRVGIDVTDLAPWRVRAGAAGPGRLTTVMRVRPDKVVDGVPRALEFRTALEIDEVPCGTGSANLVFLAPMVHRNHRTHSRRAALDAVRGPGGRPHPAAGSTRMPVREPAREQVRGSAYESAHESAYEFAHDPVDAGEVGRGDPRNVLLHAPSALAHGRLSAAVHVPPHWPAGRCGGDGDGHVPALALLEALRQTSLLAVGRGHGMAAGRSTLAALQVHVRGYAEADLPMRCAAVAGRPGRDAEGRRTASLTLTLAQAGRTVLEATTTVVEDH